MASEPVLSSDVWEIQQRTLRLEWDFALSYREPDIPGGVSCNGNHFGRRPPDQLAEVEIRVRMAYKRRFPQGLSRQRRGFITFVSHS
jgi:hypothetical protein